MTPLQLADAEFVSSPTCPLCHRLDDTITAEALAAGGDWVCKRCGQRWSAARLATVEMYRRYNT